MHFSSVPVQKEEEDDVTKAAIKGKGGLFGTGVSEWFALPLGIAAAVPMLKFDWYIVNEETQLAAVFVAFCVTFYTQAGDAVYKALSEKGQAILDEQNEAEDKVIAALEEKLEFLKANSDQVGMAEEVNKIRAKTYDYLNAAGAVKPQHDFKVQVEKVLNMIAQEEASVTEKAKAALMEEATASVTGQFASSKTLKKAALDAAIGAIKGKTGKGGDPVQGEFAKFFQTKAAEASKKDDTSEEEAQRAALLAKMNSIAKNEGFFFEFDASGKPKMRA